MMGVFVSCGPIKSKTGNKKHTCLRATGKKLKSSLKKKKQDFMGDAQSNFVHHLSFPSFLTF